MTAKGRKKRQLLNRYVAETDANRARMVRTAKEKAAAELKRKAANRNDGAARFYSDKGAQQ